jgi:Asp-tRNA(Asn)/Glu-tRNA(Gln) amidotransferase A subunit family amidase
MMVMRAMETVMEQVDLYVGGNDLVLTNLTGHPTVVMPYRKKEKTNEDGTPTQPGSITFTGRLHQEASLLAVAQAFQIATGDNIPRPPKFT